MTPQGTLPTLLNITAITANRLIWHARDFTGLTKENSRNAATGKQRTMPKRYLRGNTEAALRLTTMNNGRGERIRTSDSYVPNVVLYQAELRPDRNNVSASKT